METRSSPLPESRPPQRSRRPLARTATDKHDRVRALVRKKLREPFYSLEMFFRLAETFQALGDTTRVQIVWALSIGELCVGDLALLLGLSQPVVSHHLRSLRNLKLVRVRKAGRASFYSLDDQHIHLLLDHGIEHVGELM